MQKLDIFLSLSLVIIGIKYLFGLSSYADIMLYDESNYLYNGVYLLKEGFPDVLNAPLYAIWYFLLSLFQSDLTSLYFLNYTIIAILLPLSLFIALRVQGVSSVASFTFSFFILLSAGNLIVPLVGQFVLIIILISLIFYKEDLLPLQIGALCATLVRPEFVLAFILLLLYAWKKKQLNFYMLFFLPLLFLLFFNSDDRSFFAFSQHFSLNWVNWNNSELSPWTNYQEIMKQNFGNSESVIGAFFYNPSLFLTHVFENMLSIGKASLDVLKHAFIFEGWEILIFIGVIGFASSKLRFNKVISFAILLLPSLISLIIIYPRKHYLFVMLVLLFFLILISVKKQTNEKIHHWIIIVVILFLITPSASKLLGYSTQPYLTTINYLKSLQIHKDINLLEADGGYNIYLGANFKRIAEYDKDCEFDEFLKKRNINMIVISGKLLNFNTFKEDPQWAAFLSNPHPFKVYKIPSANRYLFVK